MVDSKSSPRKKAPEKAKPSKEDDEATARRAQLEEKEGRGRTLGDPHSGRGPRPLRLDPEAPDEEVEREKTAWKEGRNQHPGPKTVARNRPEPEKVEPPREPTLEEIKAKERRGHIQRV